MKIKIISTVLLAVFAGTAHSYTPADNPADNPAATPWSPFVTITRLYPVKEGLIFLTTYADPDLSTCDRGKRFVINKSHANYETLANAMLAAFMADRNISFIPVAGQSPVCAPLIDRFTIIPQ